MLRQLYILILLISTLPGESYIPISKLRNSFSLKPLSIASRAKSPLFSTKFLTVDEDRVAVFGGTGGVGELITIGLRETGYRASPIARSAPRKDEQGRGLNLVDASVEDIIVALADCQGVVIATGTTAFPTARWKGGNTPENIDLKATEKILAAIKLINSERGVDDPSRIKKVLLLTSIGTNRRGDFPFIILNLFGVLDAKRASEENLMRAAKEANFSYVICRPGRLIGGPYTNLDLAALFKIESRVEDGGVTLEEGDTLIGDCSRDRAAMASVMALINGVAADIDFAIVDDDDSESLSRDDWGEEYGCLAGLDCKY